MKIILDAKVLNPNGSNIFVKNGDAAHNSSKTGTIEYIYKVGHDKIN